MSHKTEFVTITINNFPGDLWRKIKSEAALAGVPVRNFVIGGLLEFICRPSGAEGGTIVEKGNVSRMRRK